MKLLKFNPLINCEAVLISQGYEELVQLAAAINTAQQLDDLFEAVKASQEHCVLVEHSGLKAKTPTSRSSDKHLNTVKEVVYELLLDLNLLGALYSKGQQCSLLDFVQFIIQHPYLFEAKEGSTSILTICRVLEEAFPSWASHDDISLYTKTLELDWLEPEHLDIPRGDLSMWDGPLKALKHIDHCMTPMEKLGCLVEFITRTVDRVFLYSFKEVVSADDSLPVIIYLLVKAQPLRIHSNINFISKFRHQRKLLADRGFCLSQVQSAIAFIAQVDSSSLTISAEEFEREVAEARRRHHIDR
jgi:hypothetical protein